MLEPLPDGDSGSPVRHSFDSLWRSACNELRRHRFTLDRTDTRAGVITTKPVGSQHFFEFWRRDTATARDFWEATLCPIRRTAQVAIQPAAAADAYLVDVTVRKQRLSTPERQFNSSAAAFHFFRPSLPTVRTGRPALPEENTWIDLGRDPAMEALLRERILLAAAEAG